MPGTDRIVNAFIANHAPFMRLPADIGRKWYSKVQAGTRVSIQ